MNRHSDGDADQQLLPRPVDSSIFIEITLTATSSGRILVRAGGEGVPVGRIQEKLGIPASTLSHHCKRLIANRRMHVATGHGAYLPRQLSRHARADRLSRRRVLR
jgi:hypothetical protein